ncbi:MAG TPA: sigma-70 family RNA polymerase sigma factor [Kofleriaceae bacterium]|nr:sigma-70 family RNA polymerase sigma factor [Kofleriaceae bacterium]
MGRSDAELLEASKRGERAAFGALIERYQDTVCAVTYSRTGDRALSEDLAQDTFIAAWGQLDRLREPSRLRAWLCGIARNLARKARRRSVREAPLEHPLVFEGENPFDRTAGAESERVVREALSRVPGTYRDALVLYYRDQRSARDVAVALGISEAAALQRLARGRQYLADGVQDLVERSLRGARARRSLVAGVLAALPAFAPSRAHATPFPSHGAHMLKIALAAAALTAAGTTAYVTHHHAPVTPIALAAAGAPAAAPTPPPAPPVRSSVIAPPAARAGAPSGGECKNAAEPAFDDTAVDAATIKRLGLDRGPGRGPANAPVTIVAFTDMQCPFCSKSVGTIDQLWDEYPGKLQLIVKQFVVHPDANLAAEALFAADAQGDFWSLYDLVMAHQEVEDQTHDALIAMAKQVGLDVKAFRAALDNHTYADAVAADLKVGKELGVQGTPMFLINGKKVFGAQPIEKMRAAIDDALAAAAK